MAHDRGFTVLGHKHMLAGFVMAASTVAHSGEFVTATVVDHVVQKIRKIPVEETVCQKQQVPVYSEQRQGSEPSFGDLVVGAAIGSAIGNAISDKPGVGTLGGGHRGTLCTQKPLRTNDCWLPRAGQLLHADII